MTSKFIHRTELAGGLKMESYADGRIHLYTDRGVWHVTTAFLADILKNYHAHWGAIPVTTDFPGWDILAGEDHVKSS